MLEGLFLATKNRGGEVHRELREILPRGFPEAEASGRLAL
jgi:hypothetical protein